MTSLELAYFAGFFDGEGCVNIWRARKTNSYQVRVVISSTNKGIMEKFQGKFGGSISTIVSVQGNNKPFWIWKISGTDVTKFLVMIQPYSILKNEQIKIGLRLRKMIEEKRKTRKDVLVKKELKNMMHKLNKRGVA